MEKKVTEELVFSVLETSIITEIMEEVQRATAKHPPFPTIHHGVAVLDEEFTEFKAEAYRSKVCEPCLRKEIVQVAAVAIRFLMDINPRKAEPQPTEMELAAQALAKADGMDVETYRKALAKVEATQKPVYVNRPDGTRRVLLPAPTGKYNFTAPDITPTPTPDLYKSAAESIVARGPTAYAEDENVQHAGPGFGNFGG